MTTVDLNTDGPCDPKYVLEVAAALAESVRVLNHLTRHHESLRVPSDADQLLREVGTAMSRLPQLLQQVSAWLNEEYDGYRIKMTGGGEFLPPAIAVIEVEVKLEKAAEHAEALREALASAASVTARMAVREDGAEERSGDGT